MNHTTLSRSLLAAATLSNKAVNQDAFELIWSTRIHLCGLAIADGLGSHYRAEVASRITVETMRDALETMESVDELSFDALFESARLRLESHARLHSHEFPSDLDSNKAFGTTAICATETPTEIGLAYLGNGGIFHIRGDFNSFPPSQLLPWTAINYLNPHSLSQGGKNVLYKYLSPNSAPPSTSPTILHLRKDEAFFGDIIMICSDGIFSYDQTPIGADSEGRIWISGEPPVATFFDSLRAFFRDGSYTNNHLQECLTHYLVQLAEKGLVSDDCTIAVLVTDTVLRYQRRASTEVTTKVLDHENDSSQISAEHRSRSVI